MRDLFPFRIVDANRAAVPFPGPPERFRVTAEDTSAIPAFARLDA